MHLPRRYYAALLAAVLATGCRRETSSESPTHVTTLPDVPFSGSASGVFSPEHPLDRAEARFYPRRTLRRAVALEEYLDELVHIAHGLITVRKMEAAKGQDTKKTEALLRETEGLITLVLETLEADDMIVERQEHKIKDYRKALEELNQMWNEIKKEEAASRT